jgi:hypothetical protein
VNEFRETALRISCGSAISHRRSPIWNIVFQYHEGYWKLMLEIGDWRWLIADMGAVGGHRPPLQF